MSKNRIIKIGVAGSVLTAICCVTPMLVIPCGTVACPPIQLGEVRR